METDPSVFDLLFWPIEFSEKSVKITVTDPSMERALLSVIGEEVENKLDFDLEKDGNKTDDEKESKN